jgi:hypothetical protein
MIIHRYPCLISLAQQTPEVSRKRFEFCMVKTGFSARWQAACATKRASRTCFQLGFAPEKNNISEEKPSILSMKKAFSTLG